MEFKNIKRVCKENVRMDLINMFKLILMRVQCFHRFSISKKKKVQDGNEILTNNFQNYLQHLQITSSLPQSGTLNFSLAKSLVSEKTKSKMRNGKKSIGDEEAEWTNEPSSRLRRESFRKHLQIVVNFRKKRTLVKKKTGDDAINKDQKCHWA